MTCIGSLSFKINIRWTKNNVVALKCFFHYTLIPLYIVKVILLIQTALKAFKVQDSLHSIYFWSPTSTLYFIVLVALVKKELKLTSNNVLTFHCCVNMEFLNMRFVGDSWVDIRVRIIKSVDYYKSSVTGMSVSNTYP